MPPLPFTGSLHVETKRRNAGAARSAFGSQKELTSFLETSVSKPNRTHSSTTSDAHPSADCSRRSGDHIGHHRSAVISVSIVVAIDWVVVVAAISVAIVVPVPISVSIAISVMVAECDILWNHLCRCQSRTAGNQCRSNQHHF